MGASNDFFIRTTDPQHERYVQDFVQRCYDAGDIYKSSYSGLYCPACEAYYIEENLVDGLCPDHGTAPVRMEEDNYFFRLSAYPGPARASTTGAHPDFVQPAPPLQRGALVHRAGPGRHLHLPGHPQVGHLGALGRDAR